MMWDTVFKYIIYVMSNVFTWAYNLIINRNVRRLVIFFAVDGLSRKAEVFKVIKNDKSS